MNRLYILCLMLLAGVTSSGEVKAITKVWTGSFSTSWNQPFNWQPTGVPATSDDVVFDPAISNQSCNLPTTVIVKSMQLLPGYSGTVTGNANPNAILTVQQLFSIQGGTVNMSASRFKSMQMLRIDGGVFIKGNTGISSMIDLELLSGSCTFGNGLVEILGNMTVLSGNLELGSGSFSLSGNWVQTGGNTSKSSGIAQFMSNTPANIMNANISTTSATLNFKGLTMQSGTFNGGSGSIFFNAPATFNNVQVSKSAGSWFMNNNAALNYINSPVQFGAVTLNTNDWFISGSTNDLGTAPILANGKVVIQQASFNKSSGDIRLALNDTLFLHQTNLQAGSGLFICNYLNMSASNLNLGTGATTVFADAYLTNSSALVKNQGTIQLSYSNQVFADGASLDFSGCSLINSGAMQLLNGSYNSGASAIFVNGNLEIGEGFQFNAPSSTLTLNGNFRRINGVFNHNNGTTILTGSSSQTYSILGQPEFYNLVIQHNEGVNTKKVEVYGNINVIGELKIDNGNSAGRPIQILNGSVSLQSNLNIADYKTVIVNPGNGLISFVGNGTQTITGGGLISGAQILPAIRVAKTGGEFLVNGALNFGNGFSHENSTITFDPESIVGLAGGAFYFNDLLIPRIEVTGIASLDATTTVTGNLEILTDGVLLNNNQSINIVGEMNNYGRFQNNSGSINVSSLIRNFGDFGANSGTVNALAGLVQEATVFSSNNAQINILGNLTVNGGRFSCNNAIVAISSSVVQNDGEIQGNVNGGVMSVSQSFTQNSGIYNARNGTLNIAGVLSLNGLFMRGNGTINFNGIGPQVIPALAYNKLVIGGSGRLITMAPGEIRISAQTAGFVPHPSNFYTTNGNTIHYDRAGNQDITGFAYFNLSASRTGTKSVAGNTSVRSVLQVGNSTILDVDGASNNRSFTLLSNQSSTARIAPLGNGASIAGNLIAQRWTRGGIRSNRFIGSPVDTTNGITYRQLKDNTLIYGPGNASNGFDNPTLFTTNLSIYDEALPNGFEWRSPANINEVLPKGKGAILFHVGDRSQNPIGALTIPNPVVLDFKGNPNQGTINLPIQCTGVCLETDNGNGWNLLANPYASPIDWMSTDWVKNGVSGTIFIWNPRINQYASFNINNPSAATNGGSRFIGPGQAFFLKATNSNPSLTINERVKSSQFPDTLLLREGELANQLRISVSNAEKEIQDEIVIGFDQNASEEFEETFDAVKPEFPDLMLHFGAVNEFGEKLSAHIFNAPDLSKSNKTIPLTLKAEPAMYILEASQLESFGHDVVFYLKDEYTQSTTLLTPGLKIPVEVNSDPNSHGTQRLKLIIGNLNNSQLAANTELQIWPNPSDGELVNIFTGTVGGGKLLIYNMLGEIVQQESKFENTNGIVQITLNNLPKGVYTAVWSNGYSQITGKVVKK